MPVDVAGSPSASCLALAILKHTLGFIQSVDDPWKTFCVVTVLCECVCVPMCVYVSVYMPQPM